MPDTWHFPFVKKWNKDLSIAYVATSQPVDEYGTTLIHVRKVKEDVKHGMRIRNRAQALILLSFPLHGPHSQVKTDFQNATGPSKISAR